MDNKKTKNSIGKHASISNGSKSSKSSHVKDVSETNNSVQSVKGNHSKRAISKHSSVKISKKVSESTKETKDKNIKEEKTNHTQKTNKVKSIDSKSETEKIPEKENSKTENKEKSNNKTSKENILKEDSTKVLSKSKTKKNKKTKADDKTDILSDKDINSEGLESPIIVTSKPKKDSDSPLDAFQDSDIEPATLEDFKKSDKENTLKGDKINPTDIPDVGDTKSGLEKLAASSKSSTAKRAQEKLAAKKRKKRNIIIAACVTLACILSVIGAIIFSIMNTSFEDDSGVHDELTKTSFDQPFYMLLVGTDTREGGSYNLSDGRSDSCIVVRIDPIDMKVTMISIPRDTKVTVDGYTQKFNSIYASGGIKATIQQVKKMLGIDISHYAEISFNGLKDMVDAVGGVDIDVPYEIADPKAGYVPAGHQHLDGEQALAFSRSRDFGDGDFTRSADQRLLINALIQQAYQVDKSELPNLLRAAKNFVKTDMKLGDMVGLAMQFKESDKPLTVYSAMIPSYTSGEGGVSYVVTDTEALGRMMKMVENGEDPILLETDGRSAVTSSINNKELEARKKEYYEQHPDSPGKLPATKSKNSNSYGSGYDDYYGDSGYGSGYNSSSGGSISYYDDDGYSSAYSYNNNTYKSYNY